MKRVMSLIGGCCIAATMCCSATLFAETHKKRDEVLLLLSGKRFAGKDYVSNRIESRLDGEGISFKRFHHSDEMKRIYCDSSGADLHSMSTDRAYKEQHRNAMTKLYQRISSEDGNKFIFCDSIMHQIRSDDTKSDVIIIADFRREHEEGFYRRHFDGENKMLRVRINASQQTRTGRGWVFDETKDLNVTECELDGQRDWDFVLENDGKELDVLQWIDDELMPDIKRKMIQIEPTLQL